MSAVAPSIFDDAERLRRYRAALAGEPLPAAFVDLDAFDINVERAVAPVRAAGKRLRVATKSVRCAPLVERAVLRGGTTVIGLMPYTATEVLYWAERGQRDLLLGYPTMQASDAAALAEANALGAHAAAMVDEVAQVEVLARAALARGTVVPCVIDIDVAYRPLPGTDAVHLGVRRSPLRGPHEVVRLARAIADTKGVSFDGIMGYEAHIAGVPDREASAKGAAMRAMKRRAVTAVLAQRKEIVAALQAAGLNPKVVNGGGSGSVVSSSKDDVLTEITVGSGFVDSHLFDGYLEVEYVPAAGFALQVVRRPKEGMVTCHGGGWVASGGAGESRLPKPWLPVGLSLIGLEGAGEVQTPLNVPDGVSLAPGDTVLFRHAKAGELAEHVKEYLLIQGERVAQRVKTYRGEGQCFLG